MILPYHDHWPQIHETSFVAPSADVVGQVVLGAHSSIWFQCVVRGDVHTIAIGEGTNIQDHSVLHVTRRAYSLMIGDQVTVGHHVMLHGCKIGNRCLIGMSATIMDGVEVGDECIVGAGALLTPGKKYPGRSVILGSPAKVVREVTDVELDSIVKSAENYVSDAKEYRSFLRGPEKLGQSLADLEDLTLEEGEM